MPTDQDWNAAVRKLLSLTEAGQVTWRRYQELPSKRENTQGEAFCTELQGRRIAVYEYRFRSYEDEDSWSWETEVGVEFVTFDGELEWRWPATSSRWELIDAIRGQVAGAPDFLRRFLEEEKIS